MHYPPAKHYQRFLTLIILILLLHSAVVLSAQEIVYKQFSTSNGLPGSEIYDLHQDKKGFLWFATDKGLCRYDGHKFTVYTTHEGLAENVIFSIFEDKQGILWFASFTKGVCYWDGNKFTIPDFNKELLKKLQRNAWVRNIVFDEKNNPWFSVKNSQSKNTLYTYDESGFHDVRMQAGEQSNGFITKIHSSLIENSYLGSTASENKIVRKGNLYELYLKSNDLKAPVELSDGRIAIASDQELLVFNHEGILWSIDLDATCNSLYTDNKKRIWAATSNGIYLVEPGRSQPLAHYFAGTNISSILKDKENNFWYATLDAGAFMVPDFHMRRLQLPSTESYEKINALIADANAIYFSNYDGKLFKADQNFNVTELKYGPRQIYIHTLFANDSYLYLSNGFRLSLPSLKPETWLHNTIRSILETRNKRLMIGYINGFSVYQNNNLIYHSRDSGFSLRITSGCEDDKGNLWIGTLYGLYRVSPDPQKTYKFEKALLDKRVNYLAFSDGKLLAGTSEDGIYVYENEKLIHHLQEANGLAGNYISHIFTQGKDTFWVGTHKGLSRVLFAKNNYSITNISRDDGLPANEINAVHSFNGYICAATDMGLVVFRSDQLSRATRTYPVYIEKIRINESDTSVHEDYALGYEQRNISISYAGLSLRYPEKLIYYYKLEGMNQDWVKTRERNLQFANLPPGHYKLRLQAASIDNPLLRGPETVLSFNIAKHFTQTAWFIGLISFLSITIILTLIYLYLNIQRQKVKNKEELILAEQKALRAQMNPHFIFNAMNSIQHYVYENNRASAGIFLSKFASLIRVILENSGHSLITLEEELSCVRQYLELERIRFANRFNFNIEVDENISLSDTKIPSMLIQPFLENAIWHGIMPRQSEGDIHFSIRKKNDYIYCCIDDNGIGRRLAEAMKAGRSMHKSSALKNINERIRLINMVYKMDMSLRIDDKEKESSEDNGTRVTLSYKIPGHEQN